MNEVNNKNLLGSILFVLILPLGTIFLVYLDFLSWSTPNPLREAKFNVDLINRAQEFYFFENEYFAKSIDKLEIPIPSQTENYYYQMKVAEKSVITYAIANSEKEKTNYLFKFIPIHHKPTPYIVGAVFVVSKPKNDEPQSLFATIVCRSLSLEKTEITPPTWQNNKLVCAPGTKEI